MVLKRKLFYTIISIFFLVVCFSCNQKEIYFRYQEIKDSEWESGKDFVFIVDSNSYQSGELYNIWLEVVHNSSYKYRNLWLDFNFKILTDSIIEKPITKEFYIADKDGLWFGSGFGSSYQISLPIETSVNLSKYGKVGFEIHMSNKMQDTLLVGIEKIGLRIEKMD